MRIEERIDKLLIENFKYSKASNTIIDIFYKDDILVSYLSLDNDIHESYLYLNTKYFFDVLGIEYPSSYDEVVKLTKHRLETAYNFMDIEASKYF